LAYTTVSYAATYGRMRMRIMNLEENLEGSKRDIFLRFYVSISLEELKTTETMRSEIEKTGNVKWRWWKAAL
jgi:hypothetical protein